MDLLDRKAKTKKGKQYLQKFQSQLKEVPRSVLFFKTLRQGQETQKIMKFLVFQQEYVQERFLPNSDKEKIVFLCEKNLCALFMCSFHSKKKPDTLFIGRVYDKQILEMFEYKVLNVKGEIENTLKDINTIQRPLFICQGDAFEFDDVMNRMRNVFHDIFYTPEQKNFINLSTNLKTVVSITAINDNMLNFRFYKVDSQNKLELLNFQFDLQIIKKQISEQKLYKEALKFKLKEMKLLKQKTAKNVTTNELGQRMGQVHVQQQDLKSLRLKKIKKRTKKIDTDDNQFNQQKCL